MTFNLRELHDQAAAVVLQELRELAANNPNVPELATLGHVAGLPEAAERMSPWVFLRAGAMTAQLRAGDVSTALEHAEGLTLHLHGELCQRSTGRAPSDNLPVIQWGHHRWAPRSSWDALLAGLRTDPVFPEQLRSPGATGYAGQAAGRLQLAHQAILATAPDRVGESVAHLISEVVLAEPVGAGSFAGASTFWFRRGAVMNPQRLPNLPAAIDQLAHEAAHAALFAIAQDGLLCANDDSELFEAPHRADPRPMSGVIHGYAAMVWSDLALGSVPKDLWPDGIHDQRRAERLAAACYDKARELRWLISDHARLSPLGEEVMRWLAG